MIEGIKARFSLLGPQMSPGLPGFSADSPLTGTFFFSPQVLVMIQELREWRDMGKPRASGMYILTWDGFSLWTLILNKDHYDFAAIVWELCSPSAFLMLDNLVKGTTLIPSLPFVLVCWDWHEEVPQSRCLHPKKTLILPSKCLRPVLSRI